MAPELTTRCSFCLKQAHEIDKLISGPGIYICNECVQTCIEILDAPAAPTDEEAAQIPSWQTMSDAELLGKLPRIASVASQVEGSLQRWVGEARRRGSSWADIGDALGMSRQSAWERFSRPENEAA